MSTRLDAATGNTRSSGVTGTTPVSAWIALAVLMLPVLLIAIDNTVLAFALPAIAEEFRPSRPPSCGSSTSTPWCWPPCWWPWAASATGSAGAAC